MGHPKGSKTAITKKEDSDQWLKRFSQRSFVGKYLLR
jgi:hypothetical protein